MGNIDSFPGTGDIQPATPEQQGLPVGRLRRICGAISDTVFKAIDAVTGPAAELAQARQLSLDQDAKVLAPQESKINLSQFDDKQ